MNRVATFLGEADQHFGILTYPEHGCETTGVIILNAGLLHNVGPHRLHVHLSNRLAKAGFPVIRLDQSGKGESTRLDGADRRETMLRDYDAAFTALREYGVRQTVLVGLCSGADDGSYIATERDSIRGLVMLDGYACRGFEFLMRHYCRKLLSYRAWSAFIRNRLKGGLAASADSDEVHFDIRDWPSDGEMQGRIANLLTQQGHLLAVYTSGQDYYNAKGQLARCMPSGVNLENLQELYFADADHVYSLPDHRERLVDSVASWMDVNFRASPRAAAA